MDIANLLNNYLLYNPRLIKHYIIEIEEFISEQNNSLDLILNYSDQFYTDLFNDIRKNGVDPSREYIKELTVISKE